MDTWNATIVYLNKKDIGDVFTKMDIFTYFDNFDKNFHDTITVYVNNLIRVGSLDRVGKNKFKLQKRLNKDATWSKIRQTIQGKRVFELF